jgi:methionyl aminopeptidase
VRDYLGHGIGRKLHEAPQIPNYVGGPDAKKKLVPGMTLAIEPMINCGSAEVVKRDDDWTVATKDGRLCAHFEHTLVVTERGPRILGLDPAESDQRLGLAA